MPGVMLVKQRVASIERWNTVFRNPELDAIRRRHGLVVTGTYVDGDDADTVIVVMDMADLSAARQFATSPELAAARDKAGAIGSPDGVWFGPQQIDGRSHYPPQSVAMRRANLLPTKTEAQVTAVTSSQSGEPLLDLLDGKPIVR